jgi:hypothetical protein
MFSHKHVYQSSGLPHVSLWINYQLVVHAYDVKVLWDNINTAKKTQEL